MLKIKIGDQVEVLKGKDKGRVGKVEKIFPKLPAAVVAGLNIFKKTQRFAKKGKSGGIIEIAKPVSLANLVIICSQCGKRTRVGFKFSGIEKFRFCKKCNKII